MKSSVVLTHARFEAVIFDLDGVVTQTARVHAATWKQLFDAYREERRQRHLPAYEPFDLDRDYRVYVDGKPRYDGIRSFLEASGIALPYGQADDPPDRETVCGLANRKNVLFHQQLQRSGVQVFDSTVRLVHALREHGFKVAVISASKNCSAVLQAAGLDDLFEVQVDGVVAAELKLKGKPAPDVFVEAARRLATSPSRAVVVEDAMAGVTAGRQGGFALVIGVDRLGKPHRLQEQGAHVVVADLAEVTVGDETAAARSANTENQPQASSSSSSLLLQNLSPPSMSPRPRDADEDEDGRSERNARRPRNTADLPSALTHLDEILTARIRPLAVFLDYDGTLTPIVAHPEDAVLTGRMRKIIRRLAQACPVAIVSGRDLADVRERVGLKELVYAGSHGFDIAGPEGLRRENPEAQSSLSALDAAEAALRAKVAGIPGAQIERKKYSVAIHFRNVEAGQASTVKSLVDAVAAHHGTLRQGHGKMVLELQPAIPWHKGHAVEWLLEVLNLNSPEMLPLYIGDDLTDEDAFEVLRERGVGIVVRDEPRPTAARYALENPLEVGSFLSLLAAPPAPSRS